MKSKFTKIWQGSTILLFTLTCVHLIFLSREVVYVGYYAENPNSSSLDDQPKFQIDLCYRTYIESDQCELDSSGTKLNKLGFNCSLDLPIGCYTDGFRQKKVSEIIAKFNECHILDWMSVKTKTKDVVEDGKELWLFNGFICAKYKFIINNEKQKSLYVIQNSTKHPKAALQPFDGYITHSRKSIENGEKYSSKKTHFFKRNCWKIDVETSQCTETGKKLVFETSLFAAHHLEAPFTTNCVYRNEPNESSQNDCYENCIKKERKFHLLTYGHDDGSLLDFNKTADPKISDLLDKCAVKCHQEDCEAMGFLINDIHEGDLHVSQEEPENSAIIINLDYKAFGSRAVPRFNMKRLLWMLSAFILIFFGTSLYGLVSKLANLHSFHNFPIRSKKQRRKNKIPLMITATVAILGVAASVAVEKVLFDFGAARKSLVFLKKESIEERSVSVSICFDLCKIIKEPFRSNDVSLNLKSCSDDVLFEKTLRELDEITWNVSDFKSQASIRTNARVYPIRQDEFEVRYFYRDFKKCFVLFYDAKGYWPHLNIQRYSRIHINITNRLYAYFYITDGRSFPDLDAVATRKSVLHGVEINKRNSCYDYRKLGYSSVTSRDHLLQHCIIEEARNRSDNRILPMGVNLPINWISNLSDPFYDLGGKFNNDPDFPGVLEKKCFEKYGKYGKDCYFVSTKLTHKDTHNETDHISINLTPFTYDVGTFENENAFIVFNRVLSFFIIFTGFSVKQVLDIFISFYFPRILSNFNLQFTRRLLYIFLFLVFFVNFCALFCCIITRPMVETASNHFDTEINPTRVRFCYRTMIEMSFNNYTMLGLEEKTLNLTEIWNDTLVYDDDNQLAAELTIQNHTIGHFKNWYYKKDNRFFMSVFYLDNIKCFSINPPLFKTTRYLNLNFQRLFHLYTIRLNFKKLREVTKLERNKIFIFLKGGLP